MEEGGEGFGTGKKPERQLNFNENPELQQQQQQSQSRPHWLKQKKIMDVQMPPLGILESPQPRSIPYLEMNESTPKNPAWQLHSTENPQLQQQQYQSQSPLHLPEMDTVAASIENLQLQQQQDQSQSLPRETMVVSSVRKPESPQSRSRPNFERKDSAPKECKHCKCKVSRCLMLYCECFSSGIYCEGCNCEICFNNVENNILRLKAIAATLERNPGAFWPKVAITLHGTLNNRMPPLGTVASSTENAQLQQQHQSQSLPHWQESDVMASSTENPQLQQQHQSQSVPHKTTAAENPQFQSEECTICEDPIIDGLEATSALCSDHEDSPYHFGCLHKYLQININGCYVCDHKNVDAASSDGADISKKRPMSTAESKGKSKNENGESKSKIEKENIKRL